MRQSSSFSSFLASSTEELNRAASWLRDQHKGSTVSYSPKVFIPLTRLCRDHCGYCVYRQTPQNATSPYLTPAQVLTIAKSGEAAGCAEALFVLGERPEDRFPEARTHLRQLGSDSSIEYPYEMCRLVLSETNPFPHSNPGTLTALELASLKEVNSSLGLMLETTSQRLTEVVHAGAPSKQARERLQVLELAGELKIPLTTGLLVGIGEAAEDRLRDLETIRDLHQRHGHIQELIVQNFQPKPFTPMQNHPPPPPHRCHAAYHFTRPAGPWRPDEYPGPAQSLSPEAAIPVVLAMRHQ